METRKLKLVFFVVSLVNVFPLLVSTPGAAQVRLQGTVKLKGNVTMGAGGVRLISVSPASGPVGELVIINGQNFGSAQGNGSVVLGTLPGQVVLWTDTQIQATVASGSVTGVVQVTQGGTASNSLAFAVLPLYNSSFNNSNELTSTASASFIYDNNGNITSRSDANGTTTYTWDYENRLTSVVLPGTGGTVSFKYDPFGRRIEKVSRAASTIYAYDGDNVVEELNGSGSPVAQYTQGLGIDEPLAMNRASATSFYQADGLGSVTSLTNGSGQIAASYTYDSFGNLTASTGAISNPFRFTARDYDSETGLYYYRARYYDPLVGRFVSEDPIRFNGGMDFYSYVANRPSSFRDPSGHWSPPAHDMILAHALAGCASPCDIAQLQKASRDFDMRTGGSTAFAPLHSMRAPWQSPSEALRIRDNFIQATLAQASTAQAAGIHGQALDLLAYALHPILDSTSIIHMVDGVPLPWHGLKSIDDYFHSPGDYWGDETSNMVAYGFPRFMAMDATIRAAYIRIMGGCTVGH